jgi:hypothetical protein
VAAVVGRLRWQVGVMGEKTKGYLAKAGRRTERRVLEKMSKLEERIER